MWRRLAIMTPVSIMLLSGPALAWHDGRRHDGGTRPPAAAPLPPTVHPHVVRVPAHPTFFAFRPVVVQTPPSVIYVQPPPVVYVTPVAAEPDLVYVAPPPVEPAREVVYPTGRWELHGNGATAPYVWVWVPTYRPSEPTSGAKPPAPAAPPSG
ncbi:MAG: hypothetical protein AUH29_02780 [Candidatus Rokubacteria bacterium 13_1_40CM_69_27]|nr:MAG: hypothetical protein AUH29_02780 [Candidatus Rokubacteria bacterium 13_1_40CM_69_27]